MNESKIYPRYLMENLKAALTDTPAVLIHGARQSGKTTLAKMLGNEYSYYTFDDETTLTAARLDPIGFVDRLPNRCILDEVQIVPEIFRTLKKAIDEKREPGRFILTGSANLMLLPQVSDSLAGRVEILRLHPLSQIEIESSGANAILRMFAGEIASKDTKIDYDDILDRVVRGGYPEPFKRVNIARNRTWYRNYTTTIIERDLQDIAKIHNIGSMPKLLKMLANQTAQLINVSEIAPAFQLSKPTLKHYTELLNRIFMVEFLQPFFRNRIKRLVKTPKVHITDTGLACSIMNISAEQLQSDPGKFGHILETFVYNELRRQASWLVEDIEFFHFRDKDGYEVDIVLEDNQGKVVGVEVKASATIRENDFVGLKRLQRLIGKQLSMGIVLYLGDRLISLGHGLYAAPISALWEPITL
ncbi:ATP-binding protein [bacterium]|nr:ATP-binding protein [bacterium]